MDACHIHTHIQHTEVEGGYFRLQAARLKQAHSVGSGLLWSSAEDILSGKTRPCAGPVLCQGLLTPHRGLQGPSHGGNSSSSSSSSVRPGRPGDAPSQRGPVVSVGHE